jgi:hypothetical protein
MHYVTHISHMMQKHKFSVMCPDTLLKELAPGQPEHEKSASTFRALDALEYTK